MSEGQEQIGINHVETKTPEKNSMLEHSPIQDVVAAPPVLDSSYRSRLKDVGKTFDELLTNNPNSLQFGPLYKIVTKHGIQKVMTVYFDKTTEKAQERHFQLLLLDNNDYPIGDRYATLTYNVAEKRANVTGKIETGIKDAGHTTPIEVAFLDVLQRESNRVRDRGYTNGVCWSIANANFQTLYELEYLYEKTHNELLLPQITAQREQQSRWKSVWGPPEDEGQESMGWIGVNNSLEKILDPQIGGPTLDTSSEVVMERVNRQPVVREDTPLPMAERESYRDRQLTQLYRVVDNINSIVGLANAA